MFIRADGDDRVYIVYYNQIVSFWVHFAISVGTQSGKRVKVNEEEIDPSDP